MTPVVTGGWATGVGLWLLVYELGRHRLLVAGRPWPEWRRACWWAAAALLAVVGLPPLATDAPSAVWAETLQFALLAFGVAPLATLAAPAVPVGALWGRPLRAAPASSPLAGWLALVAFVATTVGWRVPPAVDAAAGGGGWLAAEAVTVVAGTCWLWAALVGSPPRQAVAAPPRRIVLSAFAAWSVWVFAYAVGFSGHAFYPAYASGATPAGAQQWVVAILWATSAAALVPVAFTSLVCWLASEQAAAAAEEADHRRVRAQLGARPDSSRRPA